MIETTNNAITVMTKAKFNNILKKMLHNYRFAHSELNNLHTVSKKIMLTLRLQSILLHKIRGSQTFTTSDEFFLINFNRAFLQQF